MVLLTPNVSAEWILGRKNYSRWSVGVSYKLKWDTKNTYIPGCGFRRSEIRLEVRNYWRNLDLSSPEFQNLPRHHFFLTRLFSQRRNHVKHPNTVFYRGLYASYGSFSYLFSSKGRQGTIAQVGILGGVIKPLYVYPSGHSISLDLGLSVGAAMVESDRFRHDREDNCYPFVSHNNRCILPFPIVSDIHMGLVFRMGKKSLPDLYRRRYELDERFREFSDSINDMRHKLRLEHYYADSLYNMVLDEFEHLYDSISRDQENKQNEVQPIGISGSEKESGDQHKVSHRHKESLSTLRNGTPDEVDDKAARRKESDRNVRRKEDNDE